VFGCPRFAVYCRLPQLHGYFLANEGYFNELISDDNEKKISYLAKLVEDSMKESNIVNIESMRRLPWTQHILRQCKELAATLPEEGNGRRNKRN
jgi:hypothetical protein